MIKEYFQRGVYHWRVLFQDRAYRLSIFVGVIVLVMGLVITQVVSLFKDQFALEPVGDLILDKVPTYNLEFLFTYGIIFLVVTMCLYAVFEKPERIPFMLKSFGMLFIVRAAFISLTQIGPPVGFFYGDGADFQVSILKKMAFKNDLFFSGHTATPFMAFLLLKETKFRWFMFAGSLVMGATVLLMHIHYSIDVFAAFFITYGIYAFSDTVFNKLNARFKNRINLYSWDVFRKKVNALRDKRKLKRDGGVAGFVTENEFNFKDIK